MKKFNTEITIDATADELNEIGINVPSYGGELILVYGDSARAWDFNTMTPSGPCAKVYPYYSENDYFEIPMRYVRFVDLTIEEASFIYPDALEANIALMPGLTIDRYIYNLEQKYLLTGPSRVIYYEVNQSGRLRAILSQEAHRYRLIERFVQELQALGLDPVCEDEGIRLEYGFGNSLQAQVNITMNRFIGFWRSIAIRTDHDRQTRIARYYIRYQLITGKDLTDDELIRAVEYVQKGFM